MKNIKRTMLFIFCIFCINNVTLAHPGRTDSRGGHTVRTPTSGYELGTYHYHNGGGNSSGSTSYTSKVVSTPIINVTEISEIKFGEEKKLEISISNKQGNYIITSSDNDILNINGDNIKAVGIGVATITVSSSGASDRTFDVTVIPTYPQSIEKIEDIVITIDQEKQVSATINPVNVSENTLTWISDNTEIATISETGIIRGMNKGETLITCETENDISIQFKVTVNGIYPKSFDISIDKVENDKYILENLKEYLINTKMQPQNVTEKNIKLNTTNENIIFENNILKFTKEGEYSLEFESENGIKVTKQIIVKNSSNNIIRNVSIFIFSAVILSGIIIYSTQNNIKKQNKK